MKITYFKAKLTLYHRPIKDSISHNEDVPEEDVYMNVKYL